jgi:integrase
LRVKQFVSELTSRRSAKTVQHCATLLSSIMSAAVDECLLRKNPCTGVRMPRAARQDQVCLTEQELERLLAAFTPGMPPALATTLAGTGMRWGEAVALQVRRVDLLRREVHVRRTLTGVDGRLAWKDQPKTRRSYRTVSLPQAVVDALVPMVAGRHGDDLVFRTDLECEGTCAWCRTARAEGRDVRLVHAVRNRNFRVRHWDRARDAAGITSWPTPHDLRHTHVALLLAGGTPLTAVQHRLGHEGIQVTSDIYGYLLPPASTTPSSPSSTACSARAPASQPSTTTSRCRCERSQATG